MSFSYLLSRLIFAMMLLIISFSCQRSLKSFFDEGVSRELAVYRARQIYDVHYDLSFRIPTSKDEKITGTVLVHFKPLKARHGLILDFQPGSNYLQEVIVNDRPASYEYMNGHIYIDANLLIPRQENVVQIEFTSSDQALNRSDEFMYTLFVPDRASTAFPCFDQPDIKATFDLKLEMPGNWVALSNGPLIKEETFGSNRNLHFKKSHPISTYLFAFAAGEFQQVTENRDGRVLTLFHRETDTDKLERNIPIIFDQHFHALDWLEEYTGIPYPYEKFDMAILPGFQYSGMEHPGAVWYRDARLFLDKDPPLPRQISQASLIAHETAHMWFGNLVTMQWFDDVWLKEVFAGFMADKIVAEQFPEANHQLQFLLSHYPRAYSVDRTRGAHPIKQQLDNMKLAGTLYGPVIYNKAPIVFDQLEYMMGKENFRTAVKQYLEKYAHTNADWDDLVKIFDNNSNHNISHWSKAWVYGKGMPEINFNLAQQKEEFIINVNHTSPFEQIFHFPQMLKGIAISQHDTIAVELQVQNTTVDKRISGLNKHPELLMLNAGGMGYGYFEMSETDIKFAVENIHQMADENLRAAIAINMYENFLNDRTDLDLYFDFVLDAIWYEQNQQLQNYHISVLERLCFNFAEYEKKAYFSNRVEYILWNVLLKEDVPGKEILFESWMKLARSPESIDKMKAFYLGKLPVKGLNLSETNKTQLALEIAMRSEDRNSWIARELADIQNPDRIRRLEFISPALSDDKATRDDFFNKLLKAENRNPEPWVLDALYFLHHPLHPGQGLEYIPASLELLEEIQRTGDIFFPQNWLTASLQNYNEPQVADMVNQYLENNPELLPNLRLKVYQAADLIYRSLGRR
ncbi:MAG: hypothetical protein EA393_03985 [Bacteroidetes bacterium]|nr:MAG: hypothetical protein EA393_03985 [Bacteroidota bacterium]